LKVVKDDEVKAARFYILLKIRNWRSLNLLEEKSVDFVVVLKLPRTIKSKLKEVTC
ncbi:12358_t:CDS:1, partial [Dentiscutata heterogama]